MVWVSSPCCGLSGHTGCRSPASPKRLTCVINSAKHPGAAVILHVSPRTPCPCRKREIFLLQMSLDTKRAEIKKLEERARQREEALKKSEQVRWPAG